MKSRELQFHKTYLKITKEIAKLSYCKRKKVGCVIVKNDNIISYGLNGTPKGTDNCCEEKLTDIDIANGEKYGETKWTVLHSESNALMKLVNSNLSPKNATMYLTLSPCKNCAKLILQAKISKVYYINKHSDETGLNFLMENQIQCYQLKV